MLAAVDRGLLTLRWGSPPHVFELRSVHQEVFDRARVVFKPWTTSSRHTPATIWTVTNTPGPSAWQVARSDALSTTAVRTAAHAVTAVEFQAVQTLFTQQHATICAHGALMSRGGRGVLIPGPSGSGKSTLACALWRRGFSLLADDVALIDATSGAAWPAPRRVALRQTSAALLGESFWADVLGSEAAEATSEGCLFHPSARVPTPERRTQLVGCLFLDRAGRAALTSLTRAVPPALAALALLPYTNLAMHLPMDESIPRLGALSAQLTSLDLARSSLDAMTQVIEQLVAPA